MNSKSRASFSSRLTEAEKMVEYLNTFTDYDPGEDDLRPASLLADTVVLHTIQTDHTTKHFSYAQAANDRRKFFENEDNSIGKLLSPIGSYVRGKMGKNSQEYKEIITVIKKIRGERRIKVTENSSVDAISRCEKSYGSRLIYFGDIITLATTFGPNYLPPRIQIKIEQLQTVLNGATDSTNKVSSRLAVFKPLIQSRIDGFQALKAKAIRIKDMVKSQYGTNSSEYNLVKGLKI